MRKRTHLFSVVSFIVFGLSLLCPLSGTAKSPPVEGSIFPDLLLPLPQKVEERNYLAIKEGPFKLSQIKGEILIIEIFSMYCPHCQKDTPNVNSLYKAISAKEKLKSRIRIIGIGAGNSTFEMNAFKNLYKIEFPLIPDGDLSIHQLVGGVDTPYFFVLRNKPNRKLEVIYSKVGSFGEPDKFLSMILSKADKK